MSKSNLKEIIKKVKLIILDVDGVLTDGSLYYYKDGEAFKKFNVRDGQGIKLAQAYGIEFAIISGRNCPIVSSRFLELGVNYIFQGCHDKSNKLKELSNELKISLSEIAYIGDDILDVPPMEIVDLPVCPKDAHPSCFRVAKLVTETSGGSGCVRELIDLVLKEQGKIQI